MKISRIMIFVPVDDIQLQEATEKAFVEDFSYKGIKAVESYTIFSPLKSYSPQEMSDIFREKKVDAYMRVKFSNSSNIHTNIFVGVVTKVDYLTDTKLFLVGVADPIWEAQYTLINCKSSDYDYIAYAVADMITGVYDRDFKKTEHK